MGFFRSLFTAVKTTTDATTEVVEVVNKGLQGFNNYTERRGELKQIYAPVRQMIELANTNNNKIRESLERLKKFQKLKEEDRERFKNEGVRYLDEAEINASMINESQSCFFVDLSPVERFLMQESVIALQNQNNTQQDFIESMLFDVKSVKQEQSSLIERFKYERFDPPIAPPQFRQPNMNHFLQLSNQG